MTAPVLLLLRRTADGVTFTAEVVDPLTFAELQAAENEWLPFLISRIQSLLQSGVAATDLPEHTHWMWSRKASRYLGKSGYRFLALRADGAIQGLMLVNTTFTARIPSQAGQSLLFLDYISTAPWNLRALNPQPRFAGVGKVLITVAIRLSEALGYRGRLGLHSLPQAESFYRDVCGMTDLGEDADEQNLRYFEMTEAQAKTLLQTAS